MADHSEAVRVALGDRWSPLLKFGAPDDCWLWQGRLHKGYGAFGKRSLRVHRVAYAAAFGAIPKGLEIDHLCRNRRCGNPAHLEAVTHAVNVGRGARATATHCKHGHEYTPENTLHQTDYLGRPFRRCRICNRAASRRYKRK